MSAVIDSCYSDEHMTKTIKVIKRNKNEVDFNVETIKIAVIKAMESSEGCVDEEIVESVARYVYETGLERGVMTVEDIQDCIEIKLMDLKKYSVAKAYVLYRESRKKVRDSKIKKDKYKYLSDEFLSKYKHKSPNMTDFGSFVYLRTYSRFLEEEGRREQWWETVARSVEYNCSIKNTKGTVTREEAEKLFDNIFNLKQFLSGRTFWTGNTDASKLYPMSNFNCAFVILDSFYAYEDIFYASMVGTGIGFRILKDDVNQLPKVRTDIEVISKAYVPVERRLRKEYTCLIYKGDVCEIIIGDSKEGWVDALAMMLKVFWSPRYRKVKSIVVDYNNVRPYGEKLLTFGGTASGHESMLNMITKISKVLTAGRDKSGYKKLKTIEAMDIANIIAENVVAGGVRRSAQICLFGAEDKEVLEAKKDLYIQSNSGDWVLNEEIGHRRMSNNSVLYMETPTRDQIRWQLEQMRYNGEPAFINYAELKRRRPSAEGVNPCGEILLGNKMMCNLTTVNLMSFVDESGVLDIEGVLEAQRLSARAGYRMANIELELHEWDKQLKDSRLVGCSITGLQDMLNATSMTEEEEIELYKKMRETVHNAVNEYANELGEVAPDCMTTIKPEGTLSSLPSCSSGVHYAESEYYIRRVRVSAADPLCKLSEYLNYPVFPEVGSDKDNPHTKVVEFPCKAPMGKRGKTKYNVTAVDQLENYKRTMKYYTDHNTSITVSVRDDEWADVENWLVDNWNYVVGISFLPLVDAVYPLMPYEAISKEEYEVRASKSKKIDAAILRKYENKELLEDLLEDSECASGACPIR